VRARSRWHTDGLATRHSEGASDLLRSVCMAVPRSDEPVALAPGGLRIGGELVPLLAGSVHYWRLAREDWRSCLTALRGLGLGLVDLYVPWGVHETAPGELDLGQTDPRLDVAAFLRLAHELGLWAIVRPGPHINAELTTLGLPERVVWDSACQARSPAGNPVVLPVPPRMFPVPSYASEAYLDEVTRYYHALGSVLAPLCYPNGPIVLAQIDNEGAFFFRDGVYDQDYHPDAISRYQAFLRSKYGTIDALREAYGTQPLGSPSAGIAVMDGAATQASLRFASVEPPTRFDARDVADLAYHLDWAEFQEQLLATTLGKFSAALKAAGLDGVPTSHNFPLAHEATPLNAGRVARAVDLIGFDYYGGASPDNRSSVARRTSELAVRSEADGLPAFACEMGAGFPPYFPPLSDNDNAFTVLCALAYGLRGFNLYMAVERDRWIGAPLDPSGRSREAAGFWRKLTAAIRSTSFHELRRAVPVRLLIPRVERRLARVMHAFGPATGALFSVMGKGARESCLEVDLGLGYPLAIEANTFARSFEQALDARGVPFAWVGGEDRDRSLAGARWIICATSGGFSPQLAQRLVEASQAGAHVTIGPRRVRRDGAFRLLDEPLLGHDEVEQLDRSDPASADAAVSRAVETLGLPSYACDAAGVYATVHEDGGGVPRVVFVINPTDRDLVARVALGQDGTFRDLIEGGGTRSEDGVLELRLRPKTVRMLGREEV
jgi:beta-galactosidase